MRTRTKLTVTDGKRNFKVPYDILAEFAEHRGMSYCTVCHEWKPLKEFSSVSKENSRPRSYCKHCNKTAWPSCKA